MLHGFPAIDNTSPGGNNSMLRADACIHAVLHLNKAFRSFLGKDLPQEPSLLLLDQQIRIQELITGLFC
jgi:hypothetical protein